MVYVTLAVTLKKMTNAKFTKFNIKKNKKQSPTYPHGNSQDTTKTFSILREMGEMLKRQKLTSVLSRSIYYEMWRLKYS